MWRIVALGMALMPLSGRAAAQSNAPAFLRREGAQLRLDGKPLRLVAVNKFDLFLRFLEGGEEKQQAVSAIEAAAKHGFTAIRFAGVGFYPRHMRNWANEKVYWGAFDELVRTAKRNGVRLIPTLCWNLYLFPDLAQECVQDLLTNPDSRSRQYLWLYTYQIVTRYKDEPTVLFWELTNEMNLGADLGFMAPYGKSDLNPVHEGTAYMRLRRDNYTTEQMIPFLRDWAQFIRSLDAQHLIGSGFSAPRPAAQHLRKAQGKGDWTPDSEQELETYLRDTHPDPIDLLSVHFYRKHDNIRLGNQDEDSAAVLAVFKRISERIGKPLYIGETGDEYETRPHAPFLKNVLAEVTRLDIPLTLVWNWMSPGDPYDVNPQRTPQVVAMMREANGRRP
ncbi:MAG: cellulase family glycosylhydrolase [Abditibacteriales bacterium]|nr:cellulase family glycosylhydrolase [Abditibacteriales bacterium]MDW8367048.1 cellulase family glycosylhydrolase [Abditibacteriales bacterium]